MKLKMEEINSNANWYLELKDNDFSWEILEDIPKDKISNSDLSYSHHYEKVVHPVDIQAELDLCGYIVKCVIHTKEIIACNETCESLHADYIENYYLYNPTDEVEIIDDNFQDWMLEC